MKPHVILSLLFISNVSAAQNLRLYDGNAYKPLALKKHQDLRVSADCFKKKPPTCEAVTVTTKKVKETPMQTAAAHPAAHFCQDAGGENRIAKDEKNAQYDVCLFKDGSMVNSWDLYKKTHPTDTVKAK